ncbi:RadC family protein [Allochromatium vinosum]|uniref:DNA repair protein RadC n=1 Tax=Allochromatium vinosum (strain ATCC 17899 / DSM 180 / NBRC 103801 / NCIMB 10441 / D) TaxID=572477 RepID=D3RWG0_ALLVD|nr:DNA repair protein RadC [Allochromatium vinosum]ADC64172.1 DNA repair protein RadC [Allochromatium vinosum DSM 180]
MSHPNPWRVLESDAQRRPTLSFTERTLVAEAIDCLERHYRVAQEALTSPDATRDYLKLRLYGLTYEVFAVLLLDNRHRVLRYQELFRGTIDTAYVHPREVVRLVIESGAAAVIFAHNHPSGSSDPSQADRTLTRKLQDALALIEVRVLDHIIVGEGRGMSFAEQGWL